MTREEKQTEAGAYVLGLLDSNERRSFEAMLATDPELEEMTARFAEKVAALDQTVRPTIAPHALWARIEAELGAGKPMAKSQPPAPRAKSGRTATKYRLKVMRWLSSAAGGLLAVPDRLFRRRRR